MLTLGRYQGVLCQKYFAESIIANSLDFENDKESILKKATEMNQLFDCEYDSSNFS
jgi:hypothetical protein